MHTPTTKVQKWGNSLAVRLPVASVKRLKLRAGHAVHVIPGRDTNELRIVAVRSEPVTLKGLVARMTNKNRHHETDWGATTGKEVW